MSVASGAASMIFGAVSLAGTWLFSAINAPTEVTVVVAIIGTIIGTVLSSIFSVFAYAWLGLVPIIACLEDDKRSTAALGRAWELMKGSWGRVLGLATLLSIAVIAVMGIVGGSLALFGSGISAFVDDPESAIWGALLTFGGFFGLFLLFWNPIQTLVLAVLYLDLRVRKEALDLEWSSYASAPVRASQRARTRRWRNRWQWRGTRSGAHRFARFDVGLRARFGGARRCRDARDGADGARQ